MSSEESAVFTLILSVLAVITAANLVAAAIGRPAHRVGVAPTAAMAAGALVAWGAWVTFDGWWRIVPVLLTVLVVTAVVRRSLDRRDGDEPATLIA